MSVVKKYLSRFARWFDRSFSSGWGRQVIFLGGLLVTVLVIWILVLAAFHKDGFKDAIISREAPIRALELILDPGAFVDSDTSGNESFPIQLQFLITLTGAVFFTAMLITVLGNIVSNRVENYKKGRVRYNFDNHILILGANSMLVNILREYIGSGAHGNRKIVVLTKMDAEYIHDTVLSDIPELEGHLDVTWLNGSRVIEQTLKNVHIDEAHSIYILGEDNEAEHDSVNLTCWEKIRSLCRNINRPVQCYLVVDNLSTFHVLQYHEGKKDEWLYLNVINSYENWAQRVLVSREYDNQSRYPAIDRDGIGETSQHTVRFVVFGMTQMSQAMAATVAHIAHFPNFSSGKNLTKICFIAPDIRKEMNFILGHYDNLFRLSHAHYVSWDAEGKLKREEVRRPLVEYGDFLDIEWEFVNGAVESEEVRSMLAEWAQDDTEYLSIAICDQDESANTAASLYLPEIIYANEIPVFVYQPASGEVLKFAHNTRRYGNVYPFGMKDESYDPLFQNRIAKAKKINYLYQLENRGDVYKEMAPSGVLESLWANDAEYIYKLSNMYAANSIPIKLRSVGIDPDAICSDTALTSDQIELLAKVEHSRWNIERLLMGIQAVREEERKEIKDMLSSSDEEKVAAGNRIKKDLQKNFYHKDIAPYDELLERSKKYDKAIVSNIIEVLKTDLR